MSHKATGSLKAWALIAVVGALFTNALESSAAPLVTGDLTIYYDFDSFTNIVQDGSGNGFNGKVQDATRKTLDNGNELFTEGVISNDASNAKRGTGAIRFAQSEVLGDNPVFLDMDGSVIKATASAKIPKTATTVAAWLNIPEIRTDLGNGNWNASASILQTQTSGPSFSTHFQLEGDGRIRLSVRGEMQSQNIVNSSGDPFVGGHPFPNQPDIDESGAEPQLWPLNEWFHVAYTYDKLANAGQGEFAMFYNGVKIRSGAPNGLTDGAPTGAIDLGIWDDRGVGDFYDGLGIGSVPDGQGARRLHGLMDEFYIFSRALSEEEIGVLALTGPPSVDVDDDGDVDGADFLALQRSGSSLSAWKTQFGIPGVSAVPEPAAMCLAVMGLATLLLGRRSIR